MKKFLIILGCLAALVVIAGIVASFFLGTIVTKGVNTFAPKITGTRVTLDSATISPLTGSGTLTGLFVGNPEGWKSDKAFSFAKIHVSVVPGSLIGDHIIVKDVLIDGPEFVYETKIISSNIKDLLKNIEKNTGASGSTITGFHFDGRGVADDNTDPLAFAVFARDAHGVIVDLNRIDGTIQGITNTRGDGWIIAGNVIHRLTLITRGGGDGIANLLEGNAVMSAPVADGENLDEIHKRTELLVIRWRSQHASARLIAKHPTRHGLLGSAGITRRFRNGKSNYIR